MSWLAPHIYSCLLSGFRLTTPSASSSKVRRNCAWLGLAKGIVECLILVMWKNRFTRLKSKGSEFIFLVWDFTMIHFSRFPNSEPSGGVIKSDKARQKLEHEWFSSLSAFKFPQICSANQFQQNLGNQRHLDVFSVPSIRRGGVIRADKSPVRCAKLQSKSLCNEFERRKS